MAASAEKPALDPALAIAAKTNFSFHQTHRGGGVMFNTLFLLLIAVAPLFVVSNAAAQQCPSLSNACVQATAPAGLEAALLEARWRTASELQTMSEDDKRNTTIAGLFDASTASVASLQSLSNDELIGSLRVYSWLRDMGSRTESQLEVMSLSDQRNTLIVELHLLRGTAVATLQSLSNRDLAILARQTGVVVPIRASFTGPSFTSAEKLIDGSGLDGIGDVLSQAHHSSGDQHNFKGPAEAITTHSVDFDLGALFDLSGVHLWNYTHSLFFYVGRDSREIDLSFSGDGVSFSAPVRVTLTSSDSSPELAQYFPINTQARYVRLRVISGYGDTGAHGQEFGIGEVRFSGYSAY